MTRTPTLAVNGTTKKESISTVLAMHVPPLSILRGERLSTEFRKSYAAGITCRNP